MARNPTVWIIILNYNGAQITLNCVESVLKIEYPNFRVLVVDNASSDDSVARFREAFTDPRVELLVNTENEGYAGGNNRGIDKAVHAGSEYVFILNNDTLVEPGCLSSLVQAMESDRAIAIAGCPLYDGGMPPTATYGWRLNLYLGSSSQWFERRKKPRFGEVDSVTGAAMLLRAKALPRIGTFDPRFFISCEETEMCFRARRGGYKVCLVPGPGVLHLVGQTLRRYRPLHFFYATRNRIWFVRRHGGTRHWVVFNVANLFYSYPRIILGRLLQKQFNCLVPFFRGVWEGYSAYPGPYTLSQGPSENHSGYQLP